MTIVPRPVAPSALRRLRRSYVLLMALLSVPIAAAIAYVLLLQFDIVWVGTQRQMAMSTDRRVTRLDGVLAPLRDDLLRLRTVARERAQARDAVVDRASLTPAEGAWTLDAMPALLQDRAAQVVLVGERWGDAARREAAVSRASLFGEQARLLAVQGRAFRRLWYVDAGAGELWVWPWTASQHLTNELRAATPDELIRVVAERAALRQGGSPLEDQVSWSASPGSGRIELTALVPAEGERRFVVAELPVAALDAARIDTGIGRFWVLDGVGNVVLDYLARDHPPGALTRERPPRFERSDIEAARAAPLALHVGDALLTARASSVAPWIGLYAGDSGYVRRRVLADVGPYVAGGVALLVLFALVAALIWRRLAQPSLQLADYLQRQAADPAAAAPRVPASWAPWFALTRDTFAAWREASARERMSEALRSSIVESALAAVITTDRHGRVVEFNPSAQAMLGRSREEALGRSVGEIVVPDRYRVAHDAALARLDGGAAPHLLGRRVEMTARRADGSELPVEMVLWRTTVGDDTFYTASMFDLTERRRAEQEIERQREALRQSEKLTAMGSLLAGVAHELNNPLAIVMGRASLLEAKCDDAALRDDVLRIRDAAERCGRIVRAFLAMARKKSVERGPVQLNAAVRAAVDLLGYNLRTGGIDLEVRLAEPLATVRGDADQLGQVVLNLLVNAQQALAGREPPRRVLVETGLAPAGVWLRVADNGPGIDPALATRIFEPFFTTKAEGAGTGLGLAVSHGVAREHGGSLVLEAARPFGHGASFRLTLPLPDDAATGVEAAPTGAPDAAAARVLVVDDEPELAEMMREMLESAGYEVATAESGEVALELLDAARFDAIVSDLRMPGMDGPALARAVAGRHPGLAARMVFVTGDTLSAAGREFLSRGERPCIDKPFTAADLVGAVRSLLSA